MTAAIPDCDLAAVDEIHLCFVLGVLDRCGLLIHGLLPPLLSYKIRKARPADTLSDILIHNSIRQDHTLMQIWS